MTLIEVPFGAGGMFYSYDRGCVQGGNREGFPCGVIRENPRLNYEIWMKSVTVDPRGGCTTAICIGATGDATRLPSRTFSLPWRLSSTRIPVTVNCFSEFVHTEKRGGFKLISETF